MSVTPTSGSTNKEVQITISLSELKGLISKATIKAATRARDATQYTVQKSLWKTWSLVPNQIVTGASLAVVGALYTWKPVQLIVNWIGIPLVKTVGGSTLGLHVPQALQMLLTYFGYESVKAFLLAESPKSTSFTYGRAIRPNKEPNAPPINIKKAAIYSMILLAAAQDEAVQALASEFITPTVMKTVAFCAAVDYVTIVLKENKWIPSAYAKTIDTTARSVSENADKIPPMAIAGAIAAALLESPAVAMGLGVTAGAPPLIKWVKNTDSRCVIGTAAAISALILGNPLLAFSLGGVTVAYSHWIATPQKELNN